jgi:RNA polymerase sigma factor (sigma-70 family)
MEGKIRTAISGDTAKLDYLLRHEHSRLCAYVKSVMSDHLLAQVAPEDLVQDAYLQVIRRIGKFVPEKDVVAGFRAWLNKIALNVVRSRGRHETRGLKRVEMTILKEDPDSGLSPSAGLANREALRFLAEQIRKLPDDWHQAITLHYLESQSIEATAASLKKTPAPTKH